MGWWGPGPSLRCSNQGSCLPDYDLSTCIQLSCWNLRPSAIRVTRVDCSLHHSCCLRSRPVSRDFSPNLRHSRIFRHCHLDVDQSTPGIYRHSFCSFLDSTLRCCQGWRGRCHCRPRRRNPSLCGLFTWPLTLTVREFNSILSCATHHLEKSLEDRQSQELFTEAKCCWIPPTATALKHLTDAAATLWNPPCSGSSEGALSTFLTIVAISC